MAEGVAGVLLYATIPFSAAALGGLIASVKSPPDRVRSGMQHFAAGVVFAALAVELLPDVIHRKAPLAAALGFALGVAAMFGIRAIASRFEPKEGEAKPSSIPIGLLGVVGVDILIDGLLLGIGFAASHRAGALLTIALAAEMISLGLATAAQLTKSNVGKLRSFLLTTAVASLQLLGALIGATLLTGLAGAAMEAVLAFAVAALLYLVTEELLVEAHEVPETPAITTMFFVGFLLLLMIDMLS